MQITADDVRPFALGCELLGSGGGGSPAAARLILAHHLSNRDGVRLIQTPGRDDVVACVGAVGAAALMLEDLPSPTPFVQVVETVRRHGTPISAVLPLEVGGVNGLLAALTASALDIPLVDADPKGRAYTQVHDSVLGAAIPMTSLAFANTSGESAYFEARDGSAIERMLRSMLPSAGGWGAVACYAGRADEIVPHTVPGTVSRAVSIGRDLATAIAGDATALLARADVTESFDGTVIEVVRRPGVEVGGVASLRHRRDRAIARLDFANEYVALYSNGELIGSAPDIICVVDEQTWRPIPVERLSTMQRVRVITIAAPPALRAAHLVTGDFGLRSHGFTALEGRA